MFDLALFSNFLSDHFGLVTLLFWWNSIDGCLRSWPDHSGHFDP